MKTIKAKKSLGQNFLNSQTALNKIIQVADIKELDVILEIGQVLAILPKSYYKLTPKSLLLRKTKD
jgi:16S rRNA (adenine1518-N6/adenine1519-N6)-dimethyltransferase